MEYECYSCNVASVVTVALQGYDQQVFESLSGTVTTLGATLATIALMIGVMMRSHMGLDVSMGREGANYFFGTMTRLAVGMGFLASFPIWKDVVVNSLEQMVYAGVYATMPAASLSIGGFDDPNPMIQALSSVESSVFIPIGRLWDAVFNTFSWSEVGKSLAIFFSLLSVAGFAVALMALITLFFLEMTFWVFLIGAFGPIIVFAWVFPETRPGAWVGVKTIVQAGLTILLSSGVATILIAGFNQVEGSIPVTQEDGRTVINMEALEYMSAFGSFAEMWVLELLVLLMLLLVKAMAMYAVFAGVPNIGARR